MLYGSDLGLYQPNDEESPPKPWVDEPVSSTELTSVILTGSAEYGSKVKIIGGLEEITTTADRFTARFKAEVKLQTTIADGKTKGHHPPQCHSHR